MHNTHARSCIKIIVLSLFVCSVFIQMSQYSPSAIYIWESVYPLYPLICGLISKKCFHMFKLTPTSFPLLSLRRLLWVCGTARTLSSTWAQLRSRSTLSSSSSISLSDMDLMCWRFAFFYGVYLLWHSFNHVRNLMRTTNNNKMHPCHAQTHTCTYTPSDISMVESLWSLSKASQDTHSPAQINEQTTT